VPFVITFTVHVNTEFSTPSSVVTLLIAIEEKSKILIWLPTLCFVIYTNITLKMLHIIQWFVTTHRLRIWKKFDLIFLSPPNFARRAHFCYCPYKINKICDVRLKQHSDVSSNIYLPSTNVTAWWTFHLRSGNLWLFNVAVNNGNYSDLHVKFQILLPDCKQIRMFSPDYLKFPNIVFHGNPSCGRRDIQSEARDEDNRHFSRLCLKKAAFRCFPVKLLPFQI
jgi:hypothetical protein